MKRMSAILALICAMWAFGIQAKPHAKPSSPVEPPSIDEPHRTGATALGDAAVVIGVEEYPMLGERFRVDYASRDADAFERFLRYTRGVPSAHIHRLPPRSTRNQIKKAFKAAAMQAELTGILWFYFAGRGSEKWSGEPLEQKVEPVLLPYDITFDEEDWEQRMLPISLLQEIADNSKAQNALLVLETGYARLRPRPWVSFCKPAVKTMVWSAVQLGQLPQTYASLKHGTFTYALIGALRGWADGELSGKRDGVVTLDEAQFFVERKFLDWDIRRQKPLLCKSAKSVPGQIQLSHGYEVLEGNKVELDPKFSPESLSPSEPHVAHPPEWPVPFPSHVSPPPIPLPASQEPEYIYLE